MGIKFVEGVLLMFLRKKLDAEHQKGDQNLQSHRFDIGDVEVVRVMYYHNTRGWIVSPLLEEVSRSQ